MRVLHHCKPMMEAFKHLIAMRRKENEYFRFGRVSVVRTTSVVVAASKLTRALKRTIAANRAKKAALACNKGGGDAGANGGQSAAADAMGAAPSEGAQVGSAISTPMVALPVTPVVTRVNFVDSRPGTVHEPGRDGE